MSRSLGSRLFTTLPSIAREYTWTEIATMTRAAPARLLGLKDRGHLGPGAIADIAVYAPNRDQLGKNLPQAASVAEALTVSSSSAVRFDGVS